MVRGGCFEDLIELRVVARLLDAGVSLQAVRRAVEYLKRHTDRPLTTLALAAKGNRVFVLTGNPAKIIKATAQGQVVIAIDVQPIVKDLRSDVTELSRCTRDRRASAAPRLLGGAHTDVCRRRLRLAPMNTARSVGSMRMACSTRTCGSCPSSHSRYTVAVQMRSCSATSRTVRGDGVARSRGSNLVTKSSRSGGRNVVPWGPASALTVRFDEGRDDSGRVVYSPCAYSEAEGHWFESSSARQHTRIVGVFSEYIQWRLCW